MSLPYDRLMAATAAERDDFLSTDIIRSALQRGVAADLYVAYLAQAYHHVRFTCPLLSLAVSRCGPSDQTLQDALYEYIAEERHHDGWILNDIRAIAGEGAVSALPQPNWANRAMVGYVHFAIEHKSPYAMLGMVHVLEGVSTDIATEAATRIRVSLGLPDDAPGFSYLTSHGSIDQQHVAFFRDLVNGFEDPAAERVIVETARVVYRLWRQMFVSLADEKDQRHAA